MVEQAQVEPKKICEEYRIHENDCGSPEVQVALMTARINYLTQHLKGHKKDFACQRGLLQLVGKRSRLLKYLARTDDGRYRTLIQKLGLRK